MSLYYQEKITRNKVPFITGLVIAGAALLVIANPLNEHSVIRWQSLLDSALLFIFAFLGMAMIRSSKRGFKYTLVGNELIIREENSGKFKVQDRISLGFIQTFIPAPMLEKLNCIRTDITCLFHRSWKLTYLENGKRKTVIIRPSERMAASIRKEIGKLEGLQG